MHLIKVYIFQVCVLQAIYRIRTRVPLRSEYSKYDNEPRHTRSIECGNTYVRYIVSIIRR